MPQTKISEYFMSRKRHASDDVISLKQNNKVLIIEELESDVSLVKPNDDEILNKNNAPNSSQCLINSPGGSYNPKRTPKYKIIKQSVKKARIKSVEKSNIKKKLFPTAEKYSSDVEQIQKEVKVEKSTLKDVSKESTVEKEADTSSKIQSESKSEPVTASPRTLKILNQCRTGREDLGLSDLKEKLTKSSRLSEIKNALNRINKGYKNLSAIQENRSNKAPELEKFSSIEVEVPCSPVKSSVMESDVILPLSTQKPQSSLRETLFRSPVKTCNNSKTPYVSPRKLLDEMSKGSGTSGGNCSFYQRYSSVACSLGKPSLPLPYTHRLLGEVFRAVDVVSSMLYNRKETITLTKLKRSTMELTKQTLTTNHLGQILKVFPEAFKLNYEKIMLFGKGEGKVELVLTPIIVSTSTDKSVSEDRMGPSLLLERRRIFYRTLVEIVKDHHERFLLGLDPPLVVDKSKLTRWHPGFDLDRCPEVEQASLPAPPSTDNQFSSAKNLLNKAKDMFILNPRMDMAIKKLSERQAENGTAGSSSSAASAVPALASALQSLPKSLLDKVRARQAAKAVELLTRDPAKVKRSLEFSRLPEMARIMRNLYVTERKNVLEKSFILDKLNRSFREHLTPREMENHLTLMVDQLPNWLTVYKYGHVEYIRLDKSAEMKDVLASITSAAQVNT